MLCHESFDELHWLSLKAEQQAMANEVHLLAIPGQEVVHQLEDHGHAIVVEAPLQWPRQERHAHRPARKHLVDDRTELRLPDRAPAPRVARSTSALQRGPGEDAQAVAPEGGAVEHQESPLEGEDYEPRNVHVKPVLELRREQGDGLQAPLRLHLPHVGLELAAAALLPARLTHELHKLPRSQAKARRGALAWGLRRVCRRDDHMRSGVWRGRLHDPDLQAQGREDAVGRVDAGLRVRAHRSVEHAEQPPPRALQLRGARMLARGAARGLRGPREHRLGAGASRCGRRRLRAARAGPAGCRKHPQVSCPTRFQVPAQVPPREKRHALHSPQGCRLMMACAGMA
mmetsp:Transcript_118378/g.315055  ORF Transcript_118378/g.315055 Transcript_118378/m.315055 type:complete len:343 (-) Transcript_118378:2-1030(-)